MVLRDCEEYKIKGGEKRSEFSDEALVERYLQVMRWKDAKPPVEIIPDLFSF